MGLRHLNELKPKGNFCKVRRCNQPWAKITNSSCLSNYLLSFTDWNWSFTWKPFYFVLCKMTSPNQLGTGENLYAPPPPFVHVSFSVKNQFWLSDPVIPKLILLRILSTLEENGYEKTAIWHLKTLTAKNQPDKMLQTESQLIVLIWKAFIWCIQFYKGSFLT